MEDKEEVKAGVTPMRGPERAGWIYGWPRISAYVGVRSHKTARRWARLYGLPVERAPNGRISAICAEIDAWMLAARDRIRCVRIVQEDARARERRAARIAAARQ